jgi:hypothetical protein
MFEACKNGSFSLKFLITSLLPRENESSPKPIIEDCVICAESDYTQLFLSILVDFLPENLPETR